MVSPTIPIVLATLGAILILMLTFLYLRWWAKRAVLRAELARDLEDTLPTPRVLSISPTTTHVSDRSNSTGNCSNASGSTNVSNTSNLSGSTRFSEMAMTGGAYPHFAYPGGCMAIPVPGVITVPIPAFLRNSDGVISLNRKKTAEQTERHEQRRKAREEKKRRKAERKKAKREEKERRRREEQERRLTETTTADGMYPEYPIIWPWF